LAYRALEPSEAFRRPQRANEVAVARFLDAAWLHQFPSVIEKDRWMAYGR